MDIRGSGHLLPSHSVDSHSGRMSVASCESYDSGVSSRSDHDPVGLPTTPEKVAGKPITIEVVSPASRGVIELIDNGSDGFIGYFKPDIVAPSAETPTKAPPPATSCTGCALLKRNRITRSISTNISEDSCDSAFQGMRYSSQHAIEVSKPQSPPRDVGEPEVPIKRLVKSLGRKANRKSSKILQSKKDTTLQSKTEITTPKKLVRHRSRLSEPAKCSPSKSTPLHRLHRHSRTSPSKSAALRRIQHHNRSPERNDSVIPATAGRHCRTRSHKNSLLKDLIVRPMESKSSKSRPKYCPGNHGNRHSTTRVTAASRGSPVNSPMTSVITLNTTARSDPDEPSPTINSAAKVPAAEARGDYDSGVGSDDQRTASSSACHWR